MPHTALRGRWCDTIVLNVHAPTEEKSDDSKDSVYDELDRTGVQSLSYVPHDISARRF
jgi:hypothetical protein